MACHNQRVCKERQDMIFIDFSDLRTAYEMQPIS